MKAPFGYRYVDGKLVVDEKESQVVRLIFDLKKYGLNEQEIKILLNEFEIPKRGQEWKRPLEKIQEQIFKRADELICERLEDQKEEEEEEEE